MNVSPSLSERQLQCQLYNARSKPYIRCCDLAERPRIRRNAPAVAGSPSTTISRLSGSAKFGVFVMLYASARNESLARSVTAKSLKSEKSSDRHFGP